MVRSNRLCILFLFIAPLFDGRLPCEAAEPLWNAPNRRLGAAGPRLAPTGDRRVRRPASDGDDGPSGGGVWHGSNSNTSGGAWNRSTGSWTRSPRFPPLRVLPAPTGPNATLSGEIRASTPRSRSQGSAISPGQPTAQLKPNVAMQPQSPVRRNAPPSGFGLNDEAEYGDYGRGGAFGSADDAMPAEDDDYSDIDVTDTPGFYPSEEDQQQVAETADQMTTPPTERDPPAQADDPFPSPPSGAAPGEPTDTPSSTPPTPGSDGSSETPHPADGQPLGQEASDDAGQLGNTAPEGTDPSQPDKNTGGKWEPSNVWTKPGGAGSGAGPSQPKPQDSHWTPPSGPRRPPESTASRPAQSKPPQPGPSSTRPQVREEVLAKLRKDHQDKLQNPTLSDHLKNYIREGQREEAARLEYEAKIKELKEKARMGELTDEERLAYPELDAIENDYTFEEIGSSFIPLGKVGKAAAEAAHTVGGAVKQAITALGKREAEAAAVTAGKSAAARTAGEAAVGSATTAGKTLHPRVEPTPPSAAGRVREIAKQNADARAANEEYVREGVIERGKYDGMYPDKALQRERTLYREHDPATRLKYGPPKKKP